LSTLWEVDDLVAKNLVSQFFRKVCEGEDPHVALAAAKKAARRNGASYKDWSGWKLSGR
jgi:CHAT domain-containing protein